MSNDSVPIEELATEPFFRDFDAADVAKLAPHSRLISYAEGTTIFRASRPADRFYLVRTGRVALFLPSLQEDVIVQTLGPGEALGFSWLAPPHLPYAPGLAAAGLRLEFLTVVRAPGRRDALWAAEQVLRAGACRALLMWLPRAGYGELRRLALAAEAGAAAVALLFRPLQAAQESSPAPLRLALEPDGGQLAVRIFKRRGAQLAVPLRIPIPRPVHAVGGALLSPAQPRSQAARPCPA